MKGKNLVVFKNDSAGNLAFDNFAEQTVLVIAHA
jgi:hypothetical protein